MNEAIFFLGTAGRCLGTVKEANLEKGKLCKRKYLGPC